MKYLPEAAYAEPGSGPDDTLPGKPAAYFLRAGEGPCHTLFGQIAFQVLTGAESDGALGMTVTEGPRGSVVPGHTHVRTYEGIYVLDGRLKVTADGEERMLTRGDFMSVPMGVSHELVFEAHLTRLVTMYGPAGPERLYEIAGEVAEQRIFPEAGGPVDEARLEKAASALDITFAG